MLSLMISSFFELSNRQRLENEQKGKGHMGTRPFYDDVDRPHLSRTV